MLSVCAVMGFVLFHSTLHPMVLHQIGLKLTILVLVTQISEYLTTSTTQCIGNLTEYRQNIMLVLVYCITNLTYVCLYDTDLIISVELSTGSKIGRKFEERKIFLTLIFVFT